MATDEPQGTRRAGPAGDGPTRGAAQRRAFNGPSLLVGACVVAAVVLIGAVLPALFIPMQPRSTELQMRLTDAHQALGLPEDSIQVMLALILIVDFVIFGVYMFGQSNAPGREAALPGEPFLDQAIGTPFSAHQVGWARLILRPSAV
jgi:hypothetical protein